ncbi:MAG: DUF1549 domain-containing protein [Planctomycetes bacterium]|nr:DUF1549 domain-containing protein [Planctomycetota bacterium]
MLMRFLTSLLFLAGVAYACADDSATARPAKIDFRRDVFPILSRRCWECHLGGDASAGLRLDVREEWLGETTGRPLVVIGKSTKSRVVEVVEARDPKVVMPAEGERLKPAEIATLRRWIDEGLAWDDELLPTPKVKSDHWAFQPLKRPPLFGNRTRPSPGEPSSTSSKSGDFGDNGIDEFIFAKHREMELSPADEADRWTLIRRLSLDLLGLPPSREDVEEFVADESPDAYERVVDRLLASPAYGERWARHWLDVARWAESEGYESNHPRPFAWRYRDYVIDAFNSDKPFDEFLKQQIAGDELQPYSEENLIATGFLAAARISSNEEDKWRQRNDVLVDITNATANAFLGLTMQCAQCHNHKTDPITTRDYYRLQAFFVTGQPVDVALRDPALRRDFEMRRPPEYEPALALRESLLESARRRFNDETRRSLTPDERAAYDTPAEERNFEQERLARLVDLKFQASVNVLDRYIPESDRKLYDETKKKIAEIEKSSPRIPQTFAFYSPATSPHRLDVLPSLGFYPLPFSREALPRERGGLKIRGDVHNIGPVVTAGVPAVFESSLVAPRQESPSTRHATESRTTSSDTSSSNARSAFLSPRDRATRLDLANWLTDPRHPLTARVWVNRLWQWHYRTGLVATSDDFGLRGAKPSHPELLDWLANEMIVSDWNTKHIQRLIVTSRAYRMQSRVERPELRDASQREKVPPESQFSTLSTHLSSFPRRRVEAEVLRDTQLAVAGLLERRIGGQSVGGPGDSLDVREKSNRRNLYLFQKRGQPPSMQSLFDGPNEASESCPLRNVSTTPLSALFLLNNEFAIRCGIALAVRIESLAGPDHERQVDLLFREVLSRRPNETEKLKARQFLDEETVKRSGGPATPNAPTPLQLLCHVMMSLNELSSLE